MKDNYDVCAIIVTYNRKHLLLRCIDAVLEQTFPCKGLLIVDNASDDDTQGEVCKKFGFEQVLKKNIPTFIGKFGSTEIYYLLKDTNSGGSGGFSSGLESAHSCGKYDAFWMMDDDGYPSSDCLRYQTGCLDRFDYVMPVSIDIDNHSRLSWPTVLKEGGKTLGYNKLKSSWGEIIDYVYPFNGSLLSKRLVDNVGYVDKRLFIWGDEYEHYWRCKSKGFSPVTVTEACFYHPANKMAFVPIFFGKIKVPYVDSQWKMVCLARNYTYIYRHYHQRYKIPLKFLLYTWLFLVTRRGDFKGWKLYIESVIDGFRENFERYKQYLK